MSETKKKPVATLKKEASVKTAINPPVEVYSKEMIAELKKRNSAIRTELNKVEGAFSKIAFNLYWINEQKAYKTSGCKNIYEYAKNEFCIARGTTSNFINVVDRFAKRVDGVIVEELDDKYKSFKSSQLILMLDLTDVEMELLSPDMSVRDMKKEIKRITASATDCDSDAEGDVDSSVVDVESKEIHRQVLITLKDKESYESQIDKIYDLIIRALKDPNHKVEIAYTWEE